MATFPEYFNTNRLHLRRLAVSDAPGAFVYASDPEVTAYLTFPTATEVSDLYSYLDGIQQLMDENKEFNWAICLHNSPDLIGVVSLRRTANGLSFGYVLGRDYWGNGYMPEAVRALIEWAFVVDGSKRVWSTCHVDNFKSAQVLRKVGMSEEGRLRNWLCFPNLTEQYGDCLVFSIVPHEFSSLSQ